MYLRAISSSFEMPGHMQSVTTDLLQFSVSMFGSAG